jgi:hypothetical protein
VNKRKLLFIITLIQFNVALAQPYFDVAGIQCWYAPVSMTVSQFYGNTFIAVPIDISPKSKIIPSLGYRQYNMDYGNEGNLALHGSNATITYLHSSTDSIYSFTVTFLSGFNSTRFAFDNKSYQPGAAIIQTIRVRQGLKIKFGMYYNREFFSDFFVPLAGVEWNISGSLSLYGVLPNSLRLEKQFSNKLYSGMVFKSFTSSYRHQSDKGYYKFSDNHLGIYADYDLPGNLTINGEAGYTLFRRIKDRSPTRYDEINNDGPVFKLSLLYRIRFL